MKRTNHFRLSFFHFFGAAIIVTGIFLMWCAYNGAGQKKLITPEDNSSSEVDEDIEEIEAYYSSIKARSDTVFRISVAIFGGLCIIAGIPMFYVSHANNIHKLPKRKKYPVIQEPEENEFDYDYDNFDFDGYYTIADDIVDNIEINESVMDIIKRNYKKDDNN